MSCNRCGNCCRMLFITLEFAEFMRIMKRNSDAEFIREHWTIVVGDSRHLWFESSESPILHFTCSAFDGESGLCSAYADRPLVCRDYPFYGKSAGSIAENAVPMQCGYRDDIQEAKENREKVLVG